MAAPNCDVSRKPQARRWRRQPRPDSVSDPSFCQLAGANWVSDVVSDAGLCHRAAGWMSESDSANDVESDAGLGHRAADWMSAVETELPDSAHDVERDSGLGHPS